MQYVKIENNEIIEEKICGKELKNMNGWLLIGKDIEQDEVDFMRNKIYANLEKENSAIFKKIRNKKKERKNDLVEKEIDGSITFEEFKEKRKIEQEEKEEYVSKQKLSKEQERTFEMLDEAKKIKGDNNKKYQKYFSDNESEMKKQRRTAKERAIAMAENNINILERADLPDNQKERALAYQRARLAKLKEM